MTSPEPSRTLRNRFPGWLSGWLSRWAAGGWPGLWVLAGLLGSGAEGLAQVRVLPNYPSSVTVGPSTPLGPQAVIRLSAGARAAWAPNNQGVQVATGRAMTNAQVRFRNDGRQPVRLMATLVHEFTYRCSRRTSVSPDVIGSGIDHFRAAITEDGSITAGWSGHGTSLGSSIPLECAAGATVSGKRTNTVVLVIAPAATRSVGLDLTTGVRASQSDGTDAEVQVRGVATIRPISTDLVAQRLLWNEEQGGADLTVGIVEGDLPEGAWARFYPGAGPDPTNRLTSVPITTWGVGPGAPDSVQTIHLDDAVLRRLPAATTHLHAVLESRSATPEANLTNNFIPLAFRGRLVALEVTQGVQDLANSVVLVAGKPTFLRAHIEGLGPPRPLRGWVACRPFRTGPARVKPLPTGGRFVPRTVPDRGQWRDSLNFRLPEEWTEEPKTLTLTAPGLLYGEWIESAFVAGGQVYAPFQPGGVVPVHLIGFSAPDDSFGYRGLLELLWRLESTLPVARIAATFALAGPNPESVDGFYGLGELYDAVALARMLDQLEEMEDSGFHGAVYYGASHRIYKFDGQDGKAVSAADGVVQGLAEETGTSEPAGFAVGLAPLEPLEPGRQTHVHEIGHCLGLQHSGGPNRSPHPSLPDTWTVEGPWKDEMLVPTGTPVFPFLDDGGRPLLGPTHPERARVYGLDVEAMRWTNNAVVGPAYSDLMGYATKEPLQFWPSSKTYAALFQSILIRYPPWRTGTPPRPDPLPRQLLVVGTLDSNTGEVALEETLPVLGSVRQPRQGSGMGAEDFVLRVLDDAGKVLTSVDVEPGRPRCPLGEAVEGRRFAANVAFPPQAARIEASRGGLVLFSRTRSASPPTVQVTYPRGGEVLGGSRATLEWEASDPDGDPLTFQIRLSGDGGTNWRTAEARWRTHRYEFDPAMLGGSKNCLVQVIASDGLRAAVDESDAPFEAAGSAPVVVIASPGEGTLYHASEQLVLEARVLDFDGDVAEVRWRSSRDGELGRGRLLIIDAAGLAVGAHSIEATVIDAAGGRTSAVVGIMVARSAPPLLSAAWDPQPGAGLVLQTLGDPGVRQVFLVSDDLRIWRPFQTNAPVDGVGVLVDPGLPEGARFYRVASQP